MHQDDSFSDIPIDDIEKWTSALTKAEEQISIVLYSLPSCPMCQTLKQLLKKANISFIIEEDIAILTKHNITHVPVLSVQGHDMNFQEALRWVKANDNSR